MSQAKSSSPPSCTQCCKDCCNGCTRCCVWFWKKVDWDKVARYTIKFFASKYGNCVFVLLFFLFICFILQMVNESSGYALSSYGGIRPRDYTSLGGVLAMHFLHWSWGHFSANAGSFLWCGLVIFIDISWNRREFFALTAFIAFWCGVITWIIGRGNTTHAGASGIIFGYMLWILCTVCFNFQWKRLGLAVLTLIVIGSVLIGILPTNPSISWEGHLAGAIAGFVAAWLPVFAGRYCPGALACLGMKPRQYKPCWESWGNFTRKQESRPQTTL
eukprot:tig00000241_g20902.t1